MKDKMKKVLAIILAGGEGNRLMPLTLDRTKPAVPFGGTYRLIDFPLSNLTNSGYRKVVVLTQYKSQSLDKHITQTWPMPAMLGEYITPVPAQQRTGKHWYLGSADAIYQTIHVINDESPDIVLILGADHVYRMDFSQMVDAHIESGAEFTVSAIRQPIEIADQMGVIEIDKDHPDKIQNWVEKPKNPKGLPDAPHEVLASMGNYVANSDALLEALTVDAHKKDTKHDMGGDIVPYFVERGEAGVYDFKRNEVPGELPSDKNYWRDVGSIDQFYDANTDLIQLNPSFNLYNFEWPLFTGDVSMPPAKFVHNSENRVGMATSSIVSPGVIVSGAQIHNSVISPGVRLHSWSEVRNSIIFDGCIINRHARIEKAILDKNVIVAKGATIGVDRELDISRGFTVTDSGITVVKKGEVVLL